MTIKTLKTKSSALRREKHDVTVEYSDAAEPPVRTDVSHQHTLHYTSSFTMGAGDFMTSARFFYCFVYANLCGKTSRIFKPVKDLVKRLFVETNDFNLHLTSNIVKDILKTEED